MGLSRSQPGTISTWPRSEKPCDQTPAAAVMVDDQVAGGDTTGDLSIEGPAELLEQFPLIINVLLDDLPSLLCSRGLAPSRRGLGGFRIGGFSLSHVPTLKKRPQHCGEVAIAGAVPMSGGGPAMVSSQFPNVRAVCTAPDTLAGN